MSYGTPKQERGAGRGSFRCGDAVGTSARTAPCSPLPALALLLAAIGGGSASAQVGHPPDRSPFRDIPPGTALSLSGGYLKGNAGALDVGPTDGPTASARLERSLSGAILVAGGFTFARLQREVQQPDGGPGVRSGPFDTDILMVDLGLVFRLTGQKSWRRLSPFVGAAVGLASEVSGPADTSGYRFGTKFTVAPGAGVRFYPGRRVSINMEARLLFWRLTYPAEYASLVRDDVDWTTQPWISAGVVWTF